MSSGIKEGMSIGPYTIERRIGSGGMGDVYLATEDRLKRKVALKVINPSLIEKESNLRRFQSEGQTLALINHKNVVSVYAIDFLDGYHFIAMEYIEGKPLSALTKNFVFPANEAVALFQQMSEGLAALHAKNVIHRDIKPHNIIFQKDSVIKIIDLGIAKSFDSTDISATTAGVVMGTVQYLAPEITMGRSATALSDVWALGAIFYEMLTGSPLIKASNFAQAMRLVSNLKIDFPPESELSIPEDMKKIVRKMCAPDPEQRYRSAAAVAQDLREYSSRFPSEGKWFYRYCGRDLKNVAEVKQRLIQRGRSEFEAKQIIFFALQEIDEHKKEMIDPNKTVVLEQVSEGDILSDEILSGAMNSLTRISRVHTSRVRMKKASRAAIGTIGFTAFCAAAFIGYAKFASQFKVEVKPPVVAEKIEPKPVVAAPQLPPPPPTPAPVPAPEVKAAPVVEPVAETKPIEPPAEFKTEPVKPKPEPVVVKKEPKPKVPEISIAALIPKLKGNVDKNLKSGSPEFSWEKVAGAQNYDLQISRTRDFAKLEASENVSDAHYTWTSAQPGKFYYRVRGKAKNGQTTNFSVPAQIALSIPPVNLPGEIQRTAGKESFQLNWTAQPFESQFRVLISRDPAFATTEKSMIVRKPAADLNFNEAGTFYTKVAAVDAQENEISDYSNTTKITLKEAIQLSAPSLISPPKDARIPSSAGAATLLIYWSKVDKADNYEIEISSDEGFKKVLVQKTSPTNRFTLKQDLGKGVRYWRARSTSGTAKSTWSQGRFEIQ